MRHLSAYKNFSRHPAHRRAMLRNLVMNLVERGRIRTTIQKAKAAKPLAEKLITLGKKGTPHHRRLAIRMLGATVAAKRTVVRVFGSSRSKAEGETPPLCERFAARNGGYTRILRLPATIRQAQADLPRGKKFRRSKFYGTRLGDNSTLVLWELCEAEVKPREKAPKPQRARKVKPKAAPGKQPAQAEAAQPAEPQAQAAAPAADKTETAETAPAEAGSEATIVSAAPPAPAAEDPGKPKA